MKNILLIGLGHFGRALAMELSARGHQIMAVDEQEKRVNEVLPYVTDALIGDTTSESFLKSLGVSNFDVCVVAIGNDFQSSLETTSMLKELGGQTVVSYADSEVQKKFLLRNGADFVINPAVQIAQWASVRFASDHVLDFISIDEEHAVLEVTVPEAWAGKTVGEIDIRRRHGITLIAVKRDDHTDLSITPDTLIMGNDTLLVLGDQKAVRKCFGV